MLAARRIEILDVADAALRQQREIGVRTQDEDVRRRVVRIAGRARGLVHRQRAQRVPHERAEDAAGLDLHDRAVAPGHVQDADRFRIHDPDRAEPPDPECLGAHARLLEGSSAT
jgi:hypothetical protein